MEPMKELEEVVAKLQQLAEEHQRTDAETMYDLGRLLHKVDLGHELAVNRFNSLKEQVEAHCDDQGKQKFNTDCILAKAFYTRTTIGVHLRALVEDWSRIRIAGELERLGK